MGSDVSRAFLGIPVYKSNRRRCHHVWCQLGKFSKFVPLDALKMHSLAPSLALYVLRFLCKTFSKLGKFTLRNTPPRG